MDIVKSSSKSGCRITLLDDKRTVMKTADSEQLARRLIKQSVKQSEAVKMFGLDVGLRIPEIITIGLNYITMEYVPYMNYIEYVERSPVEKVKEQLGLLYEFLDSNYLLCVKRNKKILPDYSYVRNGLPDKYVSLYDEVCRLPQTPLPSGFCHGDLTFSNVLFDDSGIALIDWTDTPGDSPVLDFIKLRQDARFHWTSFTSKRKHDSEKIRIVDSWFLEKINTVTVADTWTYWEAMNYLRIIPYAQEDEDLCSYLQYCIEEVLS